VLLTGGRSEGDRLGATLDLRATVLAQRVDRAAGQVEVGEDPLDALAVVPAAVVEERQQPGEALDDLAVLDELRRDALAPAGPRYGSGELVLADHGAQLVDAHAERGGSLRPLEPGGDEVG